jgi:8-oxo-dGTP diphosphatase
LYTYEYPRPAVTVDVAIFRPIGDEYQILLIKRDQEPYKDKFALPGGFIEMDESLEQAALRELFEETGVENIQLTQIQTFSQPDRDPRGRVISTCYGSVLKPEDQIHVQAGDDASAAAWFSLNVLPPLAFDHPRIIQIAIARLIL